MNRRRFHEKSILTFFVYRFLKNEIRLFFRQERVVNIYRSFCNKVFNMLIKW